MKKLLLLLLFPLTLFSCGKMKIYGEYAFQMGGDKSTHFGVFLNLTNNPVLEEGKEVGKDFLCGMRLSEDVVPKAPDEDDPNYMAKAFMYVLVSLMNVEGEHPGPGIDGYYNVKNTVEDKGKRLALTINLFGRPIVPPGYLDKILVAYVDGKTIKLTLPVSLADFKCQLCWYGLLVSVAEIEYEYPYPEGSKKSIISPIFVPLPDDKLPGDHGDARIGTHPASEQDIIDMNTIIVDSIREEAEDQELGEYIITLLELMGYDSDESKYILDYVLYPFMKNDFKFTFRDYHVLDIELLKK